MGSVKYPESIPDMLHMLTNPRGDSGNLASRHREAEPDGETMTSFHQQARHIQCWKCKKFGNTKSECPKLSNKEKKEESERVSVFNNGGQPGYSGLASACRLVNSAFLNG